MRTVETLQETRQVSIVRYTCDRCGQENGWGGYGGIDWPHTFGENYQRVGVYWEHGNAYPEGQWTEINEVHCCPDCWKQIVQPLLEAAGFPIHVRGTGENA